MNIDKDLVAASATPLVLAILSEGEHCAYIENNADEEIEEINEKH